MQNKKHLAQRPGFRIGGKCQYGDPYAKGTDSLSVFLVWKIKNRQFNFSVPPVKKSRDNCPLLSGAA